MKNNLLIAIASAVAAFLSVPAGATLIANGLSYTLTMTGSCGVDCDTFQLEITGINAAGDTEGGRKGVDAFAFTLPAGYGSSSPPTGFSLAPGGLSAGGCDGSGGFFCFNKIGGFAPLMALGALPANTTLDFSFDLTATGIASWAPHLKINWVGGKSGVNASGKFHSGYDLVSEAIDITTGDTVGPPALIPEPATPGLIGLGLVALGFARRRRTG